MNSTPTGLFTAADLTSFDTVITYIDNANVVDV